MPSGGLALWRTRNARFIRREYYDRGERSVGHMTPAHSTRRIDNTKAHPCLDSACTDAVSIVISRLALRTKQPGAVLLHRARPGAGVDTKPLCWFAAAAPLFHEGCDDATSSIMRGLLNALSLRRRPSCSRRRRCRRRLCRRAHYMPDRRLREETASLQRRQGDRLPGRGFRQSSPALPV